jgi:hypothetical protein
VSEQPTFRGRAPGNREVSRIVLLVDRGDRSGAGDEAIPGEGGPRGKQGFPRESEPKGSDERGVFA